MAKTPLEIRSLARKYTQAAMRTLAHVMREPTAPPAARVMAANALLDRGWGKSVQVAEVTITNVNELTDSEIAARIAELRGIGSVDGDSTSPFDPSQLN